MALLFLMELAGHVQSTQNRKLVIFLQHLKKKVSQLLLCSIVIQNNQIFYGGWGGGGPVMFVVTCLFHKSIYGLNLSFKMQFLRVSRRKNRRFFTAGPFFLVLYMSVYQSALIPRKLPCPKKFLVKRLIN